MLGPVPAEQTTSPKGIKRAADLDPEADTAWQEAGGSFQEMKV